MRLARVASSLSYLWARLLVKMLQKHVRIGRIIRLEGFGIYDNPQNYVVCPCNLPICLSLTGVSPQKVPRKYSAELT